jgi:hypothetical protein
MLNAFIRVYCTPLRNRAVPPSISVEDKVDSKRGSHPFLKQFID